MITDKSLLIIALIGAILGLTGLLLINPGKSADLEEISVISSFKANKGYIIEFTTDKVYSAYSEVNISSGEYYVLLERGGNDFYYMSSFQKINGSD